MKQEGIIRKLDKLGRIVIPKEIRYVRGWKCGTNIVMGFNENNEIVLKEYSNRKCTSCGRPIQEGYCFCPICGVRQIDNSDFWKSFMNGKAAVRIETKEQCDAFLKLCESRQLRWARGDLPTAFDVWEVKEPDLCIHMKNGVLYQASEADCVRWKFIIVYYSSLKNDFRLNESGSADKTKMTDNSAVK